MTEQTERSPAGRSLDEPARAEQRAGADECHDGTRQVVDRHGVERHADAAHADALPADAAHADGLPADELSISDLSVNAGDRSAGDPSVIDRGVIDRGVNDGSASDRSASDRSVIDRGANDRSVGDRSVVVGECNAVTEGLGAGVVAGTVGHTATAALPDTAPPLAEPRPLEEPRTWPRDFTDRLTAPLPGVRALARIAREGKLRPSPETLQQIQQLPFEPGPMPDVGPATIALTWAGHASWVIRIGGLTVLTDPVWSRKILGTPARVTPVGVRWEDLPPIDAVVVSHNHYDHLDAPTLKRLPRDVPLLLPAGLAAWARRRGFTRITDLDWWEAVELPGPEGPVRIDFVPAHHWSKRTLTDTCRSLWGGWVLTAPDGRRIHFAGDTGYGHWFEEIGRRFRDIDLALLPIGAYDPRWMLRPVHTDPEEAVRACQDLGARCLAPMHWSTFLLSAEPPLEPLHRIRAAWAATGRPRSDLWDLPVGASRVLEER